MGGTKSKCLEIRAGTAIDLNIEMSGQATSAGNISWERNGHVSNYDKYYKESADYSDSGKYVMSVNGKKICVFEVAVYEYLFGSKVLGIRTRRLDEESSEVQGILKGTKLTGKKTRVQNDLSVVNKKNTPAEKKLRNYDMKNNPRGIAVIVAIDQFDSKAMNITGMKKIDTERCTKTFEELHFIVKVCPSSTAKDIIKYLKQIAQENHSKYDCFVLYISTHGGEGYISCSDFTKNAKEEIEKGYILHSDLIEPFLKKKCKSLNGKPKLFFFDCCRTLNETFSEESNTSNMRLFESSTKKENDHFADILIGFATIVGNSTRATGQSGSDYNNVLTTCLTDHAKQSSLADIMVQVNNEMKEKHNQVSQHVSNLTGRIVMEDVTNE